MVERAEGLRPRWCSSMRKTKTPGFGRSDGGMEISIGLERGNGIGQLVINFQEEIEPGEVENSSDIGGGVEEFDVGGFLLAVFWAVFWLEQLINKVNASQPFTGEGLDAGQVQNQVIHPASLFFLGSLAEFKGIAEVNAALDGENGNWGSEVLSDGNVHEKPPGFFLRRWFEGFPDGVTVHLVRGLSKKMVSAGGVHPLRTPFFWVLTPFKWGN